MFCLFLKESELEVKRKQFRENQEAFDNEQDVSSLSCRSSRACFKKHL